MDLTYREFAWATDLKKKWYVGNTHSASLVVDVRERSWLFLVDEFRWSETSKLPVIIVLIADMIQYAQRFLSKQAAIISHRIVHIYSYLPVWLHVRVCFTFFTLSSHNNFLWVNKAANNGTPTVDQLSDDLECLKGRRGISSVEFNYSCVCTVSFEFGIVILRLCIKACFLSKQNVVCLCRTWHLLFWNIARKCSD